MHTQSAKGKTGSENEGLKSMIRSDWLLNRYKKGSVSLPH